MGLCYSKADTPAPLSIHIYTEAKAGIDPRFTIRRCMSDGSAVTICDYSGGVVYEFARGEASENSVWDYLSHSLERILDGNSVLYVSNNFRGAFCREAFSKESGEKAGSFYDLREYVKTLAGFMLKAASLHIHENARPSLREPAEFGF